MCAGEWIGVSTHTMDSEYTEYLPIERIADEVGVREDYLSCIPI